MQLWDLFGSVRIDGVDKVSSTLESIGNKLSSIGARITAFGNELTDAVTKPIAGLIKFGFEYDAQMQGLQTSFAIMLGSQEKAIKLTEELTEMSLKTPFRTIELAEYTKTLLNYGYTQEQIIPEMKKLGDLSLGNATRYGILATTMGKIHAMGKLQGGTLNSLIRQGWNPLEQITAKTGETMEEVRKRMRAGSLSAKEVEDALTAATSAGGRFYNGMETGSKTFAGMMSTLKDRWEIFAGKLAEPIFDAVMKAMPMVNKLVSILTEKITQMSPTMRTIILVVMGLVAAIGPLIVVLGTLVGFAGFVITGFGAIIGVLSAILTPIGAVVIAILGIIPAFAGLLLTSSDVRSGIMDTFGKIVTKIKEAATFIETHINDIKNAFTGLLKALSTGDWTSFQSAMKNMFPNQTTTIINIILAFERFKTVLIAVSDMAIANFEKIKAVITNAFNAIMPVLNSAKEMFVNTFSNLKFDSIVDAFNKMKTSFNSFMEAIKPIAVMIGIVLASAFVIVVSALGAIISIIPNVISALMNISGVVTNIFTLIVGIVTLNGDVIKSAFIGIWENIKGLLGNLLNIILGIVLGFINNIIGFFKGNFNTLPTTISGVLNVIKDFFVSIWTTIKDFVVSTVTNIVNAVTTWFDNMKNTASNILNAMVNAITGFFTGLFDSAKQIVTNMVNAVVTSFEWLYNHNYYFKDLVDFIVNCFNWLKETATSIWNAVSSFLTSVWNAISNTASSIWNGVKNTVASIWSAISSTISSIANGIHSNVSSIFNTIASFLSGIWNSVKGTALSAWNSISSSISGIANNIYSSVSGPFNNIKNAISEVINGAYNWGKSIIDNLVNGIKSVAGNVATAAKNIADDIAKYLGFHSPTKEGAGKDADKWTVNLMNMLATGLNDNIYKIKSATANVASAMNPTIPAMQSITNNQAQTQSVVNNISLYPDMSKIKNLDDILSLVNNLKTEAIARRSR